MTPNLPNESEASRGNTNTNTTASEPLLGMTTMEEQDFLRFYGRVQYTGAGAIVDLGSWLGSTAIPLAQGLSQNSSATGVVRAYDLFRWEDWMEPFAQELTGKFKQGDSFLPEFKRRLGPWERWVDTRPGDLLKASWNEGPIEFLFVDAMKTWSLCSAITRVFFPHLIPGRSLVVHQDFKFWACHWIHLVTYRLRAYLKLERDLERSSTTVFLLARAIPQDLLLREYTPADFSTAEVTEAYRYWMNAIRCEARSMLLCAEVLALLDVGDRETARIRLLEVLSGDEAPPAPFVRLLRGRDDSLVSVDVWERSGRPILEDLVARAADAGRAVYLWGAGTGGRRALARYPRLASVARACVDSDKAKHGQRLEHLPVVAPESICFNEPKPYIVVASIFAAQIAEQLRTFGLEQGRDFRVADLS